MIEGLTSASYDTFHIEKTTGTHADVFAAVGLADLLADQVGDTRVRLADRGRTFEILLDDPLTEESLAQLRVHAGYPYLQPKATDRVPVNVTDRIDYQEQRGRAKQFGEISKVIYDARRKRIADDPDLLAALQQAAPRPDWRLAQVMYLLTNHNSPNRIHELLVDPAGKARSEVVEALRALIAGQKRRPSWKVDSVQLFNPLAAKGYARLKPDSTNRNDNTKEQWTDPFVEWLRYRGYFRVACPYFLGSKGENIRVYTPVPQDVPLAVLKSAVAELRAARLGGAAPKLDALAVLRLAEFLVQNSRQGREARAEPLNYLDFSFDDQSPSDVIGGVAISYYQSLGNARAVAQLSTLAVPGWFPIRSSADATAWLDILDEHRRVVRGLDDSHSDEIGLLIQYRRFLEQRGPTALWAFVDFAGSYGPFVLRAWQAKRRVPAFRTTIFRRLVEGMAPQYTAIVTDPGFDAIAKAVRRATVQAQFLKARGAHDIREIRYDLLPELRRARTVADSRVFVEAVSEFVARYNAENARRREIKKRAPANVHTDELTSFLHLVDVHGANVVGALLSAYGTCVEPREAETGGAPDNGTDGDDTNTPDLPGDPIADGE